MMLMKMKKVRKMRKRMKKAEMNPPACTVELNFERSDFSLRAWMFYVLIIVISAWTEGIFIAS